MKDVIEIHFECDEAFGERSMEEGETLNVRCTVLRGTCSKT